jgi:site-specific DNA-cytosine methylase
VKIILDVLSLFDGISCGQAALGRAGKVVDNYFASEIAKVPVGITMINYPDTVHLGDVCELKGRLLEPFKGIDLLIGGSPCQDLSIYKTSTEEGAKGLEGKKSSLFYEYERIFNAIQPKYFLLENVPMEKQWQDIISSILGVEPIVINSELVSAALRKRLYWTNIPVNGLPEDKGLVLKDIVEPAEKVPAKYWYDKPFIYNGDDCKVQATLEINGHRHMKEVYNLNAKCNTLASDGNGGNLMKKVFQDGRCRKLMPLEYERLQTLDDYYTSGFADSPRYTAIGNAWTIETVAHIFKGL